MAVAWAVAVNDGPAGLEVTAASGDAPEVPAGLRLPFLPLSGTRRLPPAQWMPAHWGGGTEMAAARLHAPYAAVLLARSGPRFRTAELRRLYELARIAVAVEERSTVVALPG